MQCPKCRTNIYGNIKKCTVCGYIFNNTIDSAEKEKITNGLLDSANLSDYSKKVNQNMNGLNNNNKYNKSSSNNTVILVFITLLIIILAIIIGIISLIK